VSLWTTIALFLPAFLVLELVSAAPGRPDLEQVVRHGLRNFGRHVVYLALICAALHFFSELMVRRSPLW
jgi:hypothetical protein